MNQLKITDDPLVDLTSFSLLDIYGKDAWQTFPPSRTGWTDVGTPTVTGRYHVIGAQCFFHIKIVPSTSVASIAGTSYIKLPLSASVSCIAGGGTMADITALIAIGVCVVDVANSRIYTPAQVATAHTMTVEGSYEI